jgi:hypothetical protein
VHIAESPTKAQLRGASTGGTGPDLTGFPHLVYAPVQWGDGVRVGSNGALATTVAAAAVAMPIEAAARHSRVTPREALDCLLYARAIKLV